MRRLVVACRHPRRHQRRVVPPVVFVPRPVAVRTECAAARWLVRRNAPTFHDWIPDARVRLVGSGVPGQASLHHPPATTVFGPVTRLVQAETSARCIPAVPIRLVVKGQVNAMAKAAESAL